MIDSIYAKKAINTQKSENYLQALVVLLDFLQQKIF